MKVRATSVIAAKGSRPYWPAMAAVIFRLLAVVALVLMPLGMAGAPAIAQAMPADHAAMPMGHCEEQPSKDKAPAPSKMDCTAMCTALPATDTPLPAPVMRLVALRSATLAAPFDGIEPEIATPPPRRG
jgi:hypothetical protein